jgi:hypothetical protein
MEEFGGLTVVPARDPTTEALVYPYAASVAKLRFLRASASCSPRAQASCIPRAQAS